MHYQNVLSVNCLRFASVRAEAHGKNSVKMLLQRMLLHVT